MGLITVLPYGENSSVVPLSQRSMSAICARLSEEGDSQEGGNRRCLPSCAPPVAHSPLRVQRKTPRPLGGEPACGSSRPRLAGAGKKTAARQGRTRLRSSRPPLSRC